MLLTQPDLASSVGGRRVIIMCQLAGRGQRDHGRYGRWDSGVRFPWEHDQEQYDHGYRCESTDP